jgi:hypothetical protein
MSATICVGLNDVTLLSQLLADVAETDFVIVAHLGIRFRLFCTVIIALLDYFARSLLK